MGVSMRKITGSWLAATILGLLSATVAAENKFSYPNADGLTFYQGDSITVEYVTDYASPKLHIFCYNDEGEGVLDKLETTVKSGQGGATVAIDLSGVKACWFNIQTQGNIWGFNSPIWTFARGRPQDATTSSSSSSSSPASSAQTTTTSKPSSASIAASTQGSPSSGSTTTSTNTPASPTDPGSTNSSSTNNNGGSSSSDTSTSEAGLSTAAKAGIGAGVGVSAALAIAALIFFLMARRRGVSARNAAELPTSRDDLGLSASSGPPPSQQQQEVKSGWGAAGGPLPGQQQQQQQYHHAGPAQYVGSGPFELCSGPHGPELPSHERPQEMPSPSMLAHGAQQGGKW